MVKKRSVLGSFAAAGLLFSGGLMLDARLASAEESLAFDASAVESVSLAAESAADEGCGADGNFGCQPDTISATFKWCTLTGCKDTDGE